MEPVGAVKQVKFTAAEHGGLTAWMSQQPSSHLLTYLEVNKCAHIGCTGSRVYINGHATKGTFEAAHTETYRYLNHLQILCVAQKCGQVSCAVCEHTEAVK